MRKLIAEETKERIRQMIKDGKSHRVIAKELKISPTMVYQVKNNKKWTHVK